MSVESAPGYAIRALEAGDIPALFEIFRQPSCRQAMTGPEFASFDALRDWLSALDGVEIVAVVGDNVAIGFAGLFRWPGKRDHAGWISLFVHDAHHRRGVGYALLRKLLEVGQSQLGLKRFELAVGRDNRRAIEFYRRSGFRFEGSQAATGPRGGALVDVYTMAMIARRQQWRGFLGLAPNARSVPSSAT